MSNTGTEALRELLERVKENPNGVGDAFLMLHGDAVAELEALEQARQPAAAPTPTCEHREAKFGCDACVARVRARYPEFPLQASRDVKPGPVSVPWAVADRAWAAYSARYGWDQSVERLAQRGGFGWCEMDTLFPGWREATDEWVRLRKELAAAQAAREQAERERDEARAAAAEYSDHLDGHGTLVGPCRHGRDPWTWCDTCDELNAVQVALLLRDAEREGRERAETDKATLHKQAVHAAAELRHAYRIKADWNLVARAIETLERATAPGR